MIVLNSYLKIFSIQNRLNQEQKTYIVFASVTANFLDKNNNSSDQTAIKILKYEDLVITHLLKKKFTIIVNLYI